MTNEDMKAALDRANGALVDRISKQPYIRLKLTLHHTSLWSVGSAYLESDMNERIDGDMCDTPEQAFASVFSKIEELPSPEDAVKHEYLTRVASAIDYATENALPEECVAPLRGVSTAMTENLLTKDQTQ